MREDTFFLVDICFAAVVTYMVLWANDLWGAQGGLDQLFLGTMSQWLHHWMAVFFVPLLVVVWWFWGKRFWVKHAVFMLILVCLFLFFSEWILVSPIQGADYWAWIYAQMGGLI